MKKIIFRNIQLSILFVLFLSQTIQCTIVYAQKSESISNEVLVQQISSQNPKEADNAVLGILRRGEKIIPALVNNKGNTKEFKGTILSKTWLYLDCYSDEEKKFIKKLTNPSVEVVSLFLISAIYYRQRLDFAPYPHILRVEDAEKWLELMKKGKTSSISANHLETTPDEFGKGKDGQSINRKPTEVNSKQIIRMAWDSIEIWIESLRTKGLDRLQRENLSPLKNSGVAFIYTSLRICNYRELDEHGNEYNPWLKP